MMYLGKKKGGIYGGVWMLMTYGNVLLIWAHSVPVAMEIGWLVAASLVFSFWLVFLQGVL